MGFTSTAMLLCVTLDRKTGDVIKTKLENSNEKINYSGLIDEYANKIMAEMKGEYKPKAKT